jgi:hypothetical protein
MSNTFTVAGVSKQNGEIKVRFANDMLRVKVLEKNGHSGIDLIQLPREMAKADIPAYLLSIDFDNGNREVRACLEAAAAERAGNKDAPKKEVKKPKKPKSTPSLDAIAARAKLTKTPQVPALPGTAPLGIAVDPALEDAPY